MHFAQQLPKIWGSCAVSARGGHLTAPTAINTSRAIEDTINKSQNSALATAYRAITHV